MAHRPLIRDILKLTTIVGLNPFSNMLIGIFGKLVVLVAMGTLIDMYLVLILTYQGIDSNEDILAATQISQVTTKMLFFFLNKANLKFLISNTNMFWKRNFVYSRQEEENEQIFSLVKICMQLYGALLFMICLFYVIKPLFSPELNELPWRSTCSLVFSHKICYTFQAIQMAIFIPVVISFDLLFIALITNIICELKLLKTHFPNLSINPMIRGTDNKAMLELKILIEHHNLVLQCIKIMKHVYNIPLLSLLLLNMFGMCYSLLIITTSTNNAAKFIPLMCTMHYITQLFFYCNFGSMLADESVKLTIEVYSSKWWIKTQPELRKSLIMVMRRSNEAEILTAGSFIPVDLQTFTLILRNTFSFFTFIQAMYGN